MGENCHETAEFPFHLTETFQVPHVLCQMYDMKSRREGFLRNTRPLCLFCLYKAMSLIHLKKVREA